MRLGTQLGFVIYGAGERTSLELAFLEVLLRLSRAQHRGNELGFERLGEAFELGREPPSLLCGDHRRSCVSSRGVGRFPSDRELRARGCALRFKGVMSRVRTAHRRSCALLSADQLLLKVLTGLRVSHGGRLYVCYTSRADVNPATRSSHEQMKLLVTGGAGYIGSIVSRLLLAQGHEVVVFDSLERGHRSAVPGDARLVIADLRDAQAISETLAEGFDGVLHFAALALVGESVSHPERYYRTNVCGSLNLLEAMREAAVPRLVFSSTCAVYGQPEAVPISESAPPRPENAYGASKLAVDQMISSFSIAHGIGAVSLRYFNVAGASGGAGEDHEPETHLIPNVLRAALGQRMSVDIYGTDYPTPDGTAIRDYIHVDDLASAHLLALEGTRSGEHRIFNLGNGSGFSVREVIAAAEEVIGAKVRTIECPRRHGDPPMLVAAGEKIRSELGWEPHKPSLTEMIADAWEFATANPAGYPRD